MSMISRRHILVSLALLPLLMRGRGPQGKRRRPTPTPAPVPTPLPTPPPTPTPIPSTSTQHFLAAWVQSDPGDGTPITNFRTLVGNDAALRSVLWYSQWGNSGNAAFDAAGATSCIAKGCIPYLTWEPWVPGGGVNQSTYSLANIAAGNFDSYMTTFANQVKTWAQADTNRQLWLRPMHEMNGGWYPWGTQGTYVNGNTPAQYIAAWRRMHDIFTNLAVPRVRWLWHPNVNANNDLQPLATIYPGDSYVDIVGLDGYTGGITPKTFTQLFQPQYAEIRRITQKPFMIGEVGIGEASGVDKGAWIRSAYQTEIPQSFPDLIGVCWFSAFDGGTNPDWRVNSSASSLSAYQTVAASSAWQAPLTQLQAY